MKHFKLILFLLIVVSIFLEVIIPISSFQGTSSSYTLDTKADIVDGNSISSGSGGITQRISGGIQAVAQYITNLFSGSFGIIFDDADILNITSCGSLNVAGRIYNLNSNVMSNGTCFTILANGITLNCNGFNITYANKTSGYAVISTRYNNTDIHNCNIYQGNQTRLKSYAIYFRYGNNLTAYNNLIETQGISNVSSYNHGIYLYNQNYNLIQQNTIKTSKRSCYNIYGLNSGNTIIINNNLSSDLYGSHNIYFTNPSSTRNQIINNSIISGNESIYNILLSSNNNFSKIIGNTIYSKSLKGRAIYLSASTSYVIVDSNIINMTNNASYGITITSKSERNNITYNNITLLETGSRGIQISTNSNNNIIINNSVNSQSYSLVISSSNNSIVYNNIFNSTITRPYSISNAVTTSNIYNTTKSLTKNIIGGDYIGGNYWINSLNTGFSQKCPDTNNDRICDTNFTINSYNKDFLALTVSDNVPPNITIYTPVNNSYVNGRVLIRVIASDNRGIITNIQFQYSNSTVSWTNITNCNGTRKYCYWYSNSFTPNSDYNIKAIAYDAVNNQGFDVVTYTIDRSKPIINELEVMYPEGQNSVKDGQNITLNASVTDSPEIAAGIKYVTAYILNLNQTAWINMTFLSGSQNALQNSTWVISNLTINSLNYSGIKYANISVYDNATPSNIRKGDVWAVQIDNQAPNYDSLDSTTDHYNNSEAEFYVNCQDNFNLSHYIFSTNYSSSWENSSSIEISGTNYYIAHTTNVYTGNFSYKFYLFDDAGNMNETISKNLEVYGEPPEPTIYLVSPENNAIIENTTSVDLKYYYSTANMSNCTLYVNGELNNINTAPLENIIDTFTKTLSNGNYSWFVSCNQIEDIDEENISVEYFSESRNFEIRTCTGIIAVYGQWSDCTNGIKSRTNIDTGGCFIEESTSYGCGGTSTCTPNCNNKECGDDGCGGICGTCNNGYECINFECKKICTPIWDCSEWSKCFLGKETRRCLDINNCNETFGKPFESRACNCIEDWYCKWSSCNENNYQYPEYCEDLNKCGTEKNKPTERICKCEPNFQCGIWSNCLVSYNIEEIIKGKTTFSGVQSTVCEDVNQCENKTVKTSNCTINSPIKINTVEICNDMYLEIYDTNLKMVVSRIREYSTKDNRKIDIKLSASQNLSNYCDYCSDKIKNYDEEKIDCGGPNCPPCIERGKYFDWLIWLKLLLWAIFIILIIKYNFEKRKNIK